MTWTKKYQLLFVADGHPPWACCFCGDPVEGLGRVGNVHHVDGDSTNHSLENLAAAHSSCHFRHHNKGRKWSMQSKRAASEARRGKPKSEAHKAAISAALRGKSKSKSHRAALSEAHKGKKALN